MKKKENKTLSLSTERALKKVKIILPLTDEALNKKERITMQKEIALKTGKSYRTLSRWYNAYRLFGLEGLIGEGNGREGRHVLSEKVLEEAVKLRKELPSRSVRDIITVLEEEGFVEKGKAKIPTVQRYLQNEGFSKKEMRSRVYGSDISSFRFQKRHRMYMLEADIKYGPCIYPEGRVRGIRTYFFGWIDDYSRLVLNGKFYLKQDEETLLSSFRSVIEEYGVCVKVYCDNGSQYISSALSNTCSMLGIILLHAKVRSPESKGKIERFNKDVDSFCQEARLEHFSSLEELNASFTTWLEEKHQDSPHSSLNGKTPREVFLSEKETPLKMKSKEELDRAFLRVSTRKVLKDSTIKIFGSLYEVDNPSLVGREVKVSYPIGDVSVLEINCKGFPPSKAKVLNIGEDIDYEKREKIRKENAKEINIDAECGSSLLRAQKAKHLKENPSSSHYLEVNKNEELKEDKKISITRFSAIGGKKDE